MEAYHLSSEDTFSTSFLPCLTLYRVTATGNVIPKPLYIKVPADWKTVKCVLWPYLVYRWGH